MKALIQKAWLFLNGKKTLIGSALIVTSETIKNGLVMGPSLPAIPPIVSLLPAAPWVMLAGVLLTGGGYAHKVYKMLAPAPVP